MTDLARTERLMRLQELRAKTEAPASISQPRRTRPASMSRIAAAGLGASLTLSLIGAMSRTGPSTVSGSLTPTGEGADSVVLVPIHRTLYLVSGEASTGNWAATPGASSVVAPGTANASQPQVTTNGSR